MKGFFLVSPLFFVKLKYFHSGIVMFFLDAYYEAPMLFFSLFLHFILFWGSVVQMFERYKCLVKGMTLSESQDPTSRPYLYSGFALDWFEKYFLILTFF